MGEFTREEEEIIHILTRRHPSEEMVSLGEVMADEYEHKQRLSDVEYLKNLAKKLFPLEKETLRE